MSLISVSANKHGRKHKKICFYMYVDTKQQQTTTEKKTYNKWNVKCLIKNEKAAVANSNKNFLINL